MVNTGGIKVADVVTRASVRASVFLSLNRYYSTTTPPNTSGECQQDKGEHVKRGAFGIVGFETRPVRNDAAAALDRQGFAAVSRFRASVRASVGAVFTATRSLATLPFPTCRALPFLKVHNLPPFRGVGE